MLESLEARTLLSFTPIAQPNAAYVAETTNLKGAIPADGTSITSLSDGSETVTFSSSVVAATVPSGGWSTWNSPPATESAIPRVLTDIGATSLTMTLSKPAVIFGFEAEGDNFSTQTLTATFMSGATTIGSIPLSVNGNSGALLFAATTNTAFTSVVLSAPAGANGFAIAELRYDPAATTLTGSSGNEITGVEGSSTGTTLLGTFVDANQSATAVNFTTPPGSVVVNWGDGSAPQTLTAANLTPVGTPNGVVWTINAAHTYTEEGTYAYTVTVTDFAGATAFVAGSAIVADASLAAGSPTVLILNTGVPTPGATVVGSFTDSNPFATTADFRTTIDWGDGSPTTTGIVVATATPGVFDVEGGHTYATAGAFTTKITVVDDGGSQVIVPGTATVTDLAVIASPATYTAIEGLPTPLFVLCTFEDPNTLATLSSVNAALAIGGWGDGTPTVAGVNLVIRQIGVDPANTEPIFEVLGSHTYTETGVFTTNIIITTRGDAAGQTTHCTGTVTVLDAGLIGSEGGEIAGVEGASTGSVLLGSFVDSNQGSTVADYTSGGGSVVVKWGDGSAPQTLPASDITSIGVPDGVTWNVNASHTYTEEGTYAYTVTVTNDDGAATTITGSAIIGDAALTAGPPCIVAGNTGIALPGSTVIATFTDANLFATTADYTATVDWGDGTGLGTGIVVATATPGVFDVIGGHTYARERDGSPTEGVYTANITVYDDGGSTVVLPCSITITDLPVTGAVRSFTAVEGQNTGTIVLATFEDPNTLATVADVTATLPVGGWGDTTPGAPVTLAVQAIGVDPSNGDTIFEVLGAHTYAEEGSFTVNISVSTFSGVVTVLTSGTATVKDAALTGSEGGEITGVEGTSTGSVLLGTFVDANQGSTVADYTAVVNWGDGSAPETLLPSDLTAIGGNGGVSWNVSAPHTYAEEGTYAYTVTITDDGGAATTITGSAIVADAGLTAGPCTLTANTGVALPGTTVVATFTDANTGAPAADFTATIDWGDGSPRSTGLVVATATPGLFDVLGGHTYTKERDGSPSEGVYTPIVTVFDDGGSQVVITCTATVTDLAVTGTVNSFTAVEGQNTGLIQLATFTDPDTTATVADVTASLPIGGWGDTTPLVATTLVVQQIGVTPLNSPTNPGAPIFEVLGSHTYTEEGSFTVNINVYTLSGVVTALTSGTATVIDAGLTGSEGGEITGVEGASTGTVLLGTFVDANQGATVNDYLPVSQGGNGGSVVVNWGDGSALETLTAANLTAIGIPNGVSWNVSDAHTYVESGTFAYTVTITDDGGAATTITGSAIIADAVLTPLTPDMQPPVNSDEATTFPTPVFTGAPTDDPQQLFNGPVAYFTDANPAPPAGSSTIADFTATIDWGDGTPLTAGTIGTATVGGATVYSVSGTHTYADAGVNGGIGHFPIQVFIVDDDGARLTIDNTANVTDKAITVTGILNPKSDSGLSTGTPDTTYVRQPDFFGTVLATLPDGTTVPEPYAHVTLTATDIASGVGLTIGNVQAGSDGSWNIKSTVALADGTYSITATAVDQFGQTTTVAPDVITSSLLIDSTGPVIDGLYFNRLNGQVDYIIKDPVNPDGSAPSGVWVNSLLDSSNYLFTKVHANKAYPGKWVVTNVTATPDPTIPYAYDVAVTLNGGNVIQGGFYLFTIRDSSDGDSSVQDLAENHLDGEFFGSFPSGNGIPGSDFVAELQAYHNKVFAPQTILGTASAANGGIGGLPVAPVHSGIFVTSIPRGASPIFSTPSSPSNGGDPPATVVHRKPKGQSVIIKKTGHSLLSSSSDTAKHTKVVVSATHPKGPKHS